MSGYRPPSFSAQIDLDLSRNEGRPTVDAIPFSPEELAGLTSRYPDTGELRGAIAASHGVEPERVLITAGGDDALFRCFLATSGGAVVATRPSFEMIRRYAEQVDAPLVEIPWWAGDFPLADFLEDTSGAREMAVIVSPNNPTGSVIGLADLRKVSDDFPFVVLDAAYAEFADEDLTPAALEMGNVVVVRTLSKAFGLAGLRVGYAIGAADRISLIAGYGSPYAVSSLSSAIATLALTRGAGRAPEYTEHVVRARERLIALLAELGAAPLPSQANFVLATDVESERVVMDAAARGVALRRFPDNPDMARCVRVSIPPGEADMDRLEDVLRAVVPPVEGTAGGEG